MQGHVKGPHFYMSSVLERCSFACADYAALKGRGVKMPRFIGLLHAKYPTVYFLQVHYHVVITRTY